MLGKEGDDVPREIRDREGGPNKEVEGLRVIDFPTNHVVTPRFCDETTGSWVEVQHINNW